MLEFFPFAFFSYTHTPLKFILTLTGECQRKSWKQRGEERGEKETCGEGERKGGKERERVRRREGDGERSR